MPRVLCRLELTIVRVRIERLHCITEADALLEGIEPATGNIDAIRKHLVKGSLVIDGFARGWDALNALRGYAWSSNPWVYVIDFKTKEQTNK